MDGVVTEFGQPLARLLGQFRDNLDRIDLIPQIGQHGGLITGAGADLERARTLRNSQQVGHQGNDVRLGDGLAVADWQWPIGIGQPPLGSRYEGMPRYAAHGLKHAVIERRRYRAAAVLARDHLDRANHVAPGSCLRAQLPPAWRRRAAAQRSRSPAAAKTLFR